MGELSSSNCVRINFPYQTLATRDCPKSVRKKEIEMATVPEFISSDKCDEVQCIQVVTLPPPGG